MILFAGCGNMNSIETETTKEILETSNAVEYTRAPNEPPKLIDSESKFESPYITEASLRRVISEIENANTSSDYRRVFLSDLEVLNIVCQVKESRDHSCYYTVLKSDKGKLFVFLGGYLLGGDMELDSKTLQLNIALYSEKKLTQSDFNKIKSYVTTIKDVIKIDPATEHINSSLFDPIIDGVQMGKSEFEKYSIHMISDGVMFIGYKKVSNTYLVEHIEKIEDEWIAGINDIDR